MTNNKYSSPFNKMGLNCVGPLMSTKFKPILSQEPTVFSTEGGNPLMQKAN